MSLTQSIDYTTDTYEVNITNAHIEDGTTQDTSSASNFSVLLDPSLSLSPLLHLRAVEAELTLDTLQIGGLPLSFTCLEECKILLTLPLDIVKCNRQINDEQLKPLNATPLKLKSDDHICETPKDVIAFINDKFRYSVNYYIIASYLRIFFDDEILKDFDNKPLSLQDINLLLQYIDAMLHIRHTAHLRLCALLGDNIDIASKIKTTEKKGFITSTNEAKALRESECLKPTAERPETPNTKFFDFSLFHAKTCNLNANATGPDKDRDAINSSIITDFDNWLTNVDVDINADKFTPKAIKDLNTYRLSNQNLIDVGLQARNILFLEKDRIAGKAKPKSQLFHQDFFVAELDLSQQRTIFKLHPKQFFLFQQKYHTH